jgi:hypothetical protein
MIAVVLLAAALNFPLPCSYQSNSARGAPLIVGGRIDTAAVKERARWPRLVLDIAPFGNLRGTGWRQVPPLIRQFNRRAQVLGYIQTNSVWFAPGSAPTEGFWRDFYYCLMHFNAWLYAPDGTLHDTWNVNWGNRAFADSMATLLLRQNALGIWDGFFLDSWCQGIKWSGEGGNEPINYVRAGFANGDQMDSARTVNMSRVISRLKAAGVAVWTNSGPEPIAGVDGGLREGFDAGLTTPSQAIGWVRTPGTHWLKAEHFGGAYTPEACRIARYTLGVSCLGTDGSCASMGPDRGAAGWYDEYSVGPSNLADSTGAYTGWLGRSGEATEVTPGVWLRWFERGAVIVNTTSAPQLVLTWRELYRIRGRRDPITNSGQPGVYFLVPARDALFLVSPALTDASGSNGVPTRFFARALPNPAHGRSEIVYALGADADVTVRIFDPGGRVAATLLDGVRQPAGEHRVPLAGRGLSPGIYFFRVRAGDQESEGRIVIL